MFFFFLTVHEDQEDKGIIPFELALSFINLV